MAVRKKSNRWVVEFMQRGDRVFRRLPAGTTKADAHHLESKLRRQIFNAVDLGKLQDPLLSKVIDEWLETIKGRKSATHTASHAAAVKRQVGNSPLSGLPDCARALSQQTIRANGAEAGNLKGRHLAAGTVNRRLCVLKAVAKYVYLKGYTPENLSAKIQLLPEKSYTRRDVTSDKVQAIMDAANTPRARALIAFGAYTGMRLGEILKLAPGDVVGGFIRVVDAKNGEDRDIPIPDELKPHLGLLPFKGNWRNVYRGWLSARRRSGVNIRFHDLRHHAATAMSEAGDPILLMDVMGWKSVQTARKYVHPSMASKAELMKRVTSRLHQAGKKKAPK